MGGWLRSCALHRRRALLHPYVPCHLDPQVEHRLSKVVLRLPTKTNDPRGHRESPSEFF